MTVQKHYLTVISREAHTACGIRADIVFPGRQEAVSFRVQRRNGVNETRSNGFLFETDPAGVTCKACRAALVESRLHLHAETQDPPVTTVPVERRPITRPRSDYPITDNRGEEQ